MEPIDLSSIDVGSKDAERRENVVDLSRYIVPFDGLSNIDTVRNMFEDEDVSNIFESIVPSGVSVYFKYDSRFERRIQTFFLFHFIFFFIIFFN